MSRVAWNAEHRGRVEHVGLLDPGDPPNALDEFFLCALCENAPGKIPVTVFDRISDIGDGDVIVLQELGP